MDGSHPLGDYIQPFQIEAPGIRGRLVRLGASYERAITPHAYPDDLAELMGETMALTAILASALKYDGIFTLQAEGDGPVRYIVSDMTGEGAIRGYARADADDIEKAQARGGGPVPRLLGSGRLAFTVDQGPETERYQGITELIGGTMAECAHHYFRQSEQLETAIVLAAGGLGEGERPRAAALMLQRLPREEESDDEDWRRAVILLSSITHAELLDPDLGPDRLLLRLFHEDGVRLFRRRDVFHRCRCSAERVERTLRSFPREEIDKMAEEDGRVVVTCEFCKAAYAYGPDDLDALFADGPEDEHRGPPN